MIPCVSKPHDGLKHFTFKNIFPSQVKSVSSFMHASENSLSTKRFASDLHVYKQVLNIQSLRQVHKRVMIIGPVKSPKTNSLVSFSVGPSRKIDIKNGFSQTFLFCSIDYFSQTLFNFVGSLLITCLLVTLSAMVYFMNIFKWKYK